LCIQIKSFFWSTVGVALRFCDRGDYNVPTATKSQGKTGFVKDFLKDNPKGNTKAVNQAWTAAGLSGTIGPTLINKMRSEMGLTGNLRATSQKPRTVAKEKSTSKVSKTASSPGKTMFVKEFLNDHPQANVDAVNEAWQTAGFDGTISDTLVNKTRALLGLTGNIRGNTKKPKTGVTGKKRGRPRKETTAAVDGQPQRSNSARTVVLDDLEADIDRLIFKMMGIGDLTEIEDTLRRARRLLYGAFNGG
jgi:hypothetical protein